MPEYYGVHIGKHTLYQKYQIKDTDYYVNDDGLYVRNETYWYGPFRYSVIDDSKTLDKLNNVCCHINVIYVGDNLYVRTRTDEWISPKYYKYPYYTNKTLYTTYIDNNRNVLINVPFTDKSLDDWTYFVDEQKIETTVCRYKKLYNRGHDQLGHFGTELSQDKMDDVYFGRGNHETILDRLYIYVYYICTMPIHSIELVKPEESEPEII
jgi:hypothetical protein